MLHAMPRWVIEGDACTEGVAERWTESETYQGYGPFTLKEWIHDSHLTILANPFWPGTEEIPAPTIAGVIVHIMDSSAGLSEYEAGNMDTAGITAADYDRIMTDPVDRKSTRLNSSHHRISYAVFCLKKKKLSQPQH